MNRTTVVLVVLFLCILSVPAHGQEALQGHWNVMLWVNGDNPNGGSLDHPFWLHCTTSDVDEVQGLLASRVCTDSLNVGMRIISGYFSSGKIYIEGSDVTGDFTVSRSDVDWWDQDVFKIYKGTINKEGNKIYAVGNWYTVEFVLEMTKVDW